MEITEVIVAHGHKNLLAAHRTTLEITKEAHLSEEGTCIISVSANKAMGDFSPLFKEHLRRSSAKLTILIEAGDTAEVVNAFGSPQLTFAHPTDMVVRKSDYVCKRTLAIKADKAACDLSKKLVRLLQRPEQEVKITLKVKT